MAAFSAKDISLNYGNAATALINVSIDIPDGAVVAVLGANGAGKTSLVRALTGQHRFYRARRTGVLHLDGADVTGDDAVGLNRAGIAQVPEGRKLFASLSVRENILTGALAQKSRSNAAVAAKLEELLEIFPKLRTLLETPAGLLSGGEQQMVAISRALASEPKILICDELSLGLAPIAVSDIYSKLVDLNRRTGMSLLIIEQNARQALRMATYAYVLEVGEVAAQGDAKAMATSKDFEKYYLGAH